MNRKKGVFIFSTALLILLAVVGQLLCDTLGFGQGLLKEVVTIFAACAAAAITFFSICLLQKDNKIAKVLSRIFGCLFIIFIVIFSGSILKATGDYSDIYGTGWWISYVDKLEDERRLWSLAKWVGKGEPYYQYDNAVVKIPAKNEEEASKEPYKSALDERVRSEHVYQFFYSDTMLNVLSYQFGRWVLCLYILAAIIWSLSSFYLLLAITGVWNKGLFLSAWFLMLLNVWLPVLNCAGLVFSYWGPPFTGYGRGYLEYNILLIGVPIGAMLAFSSSGKVVLKSLTGEEQNQIRKGIR